MVMMTARWPWGLGMVLMGLGVAATATMTTDAAANGAAGAGGGLDCVQVCTDLFNCGLATDGGNQLCPPWQAGQLQTYLQGCEGNDGCVADCQALPAMAALVNPNDCPATVTTMAGASNEFHDDCVNGLGCGGAGGTTSSGTAGEGGAGGSTSSGTAGSGGAGGSTSSGTGGLGGNSTSSGTSSGTTSTSGVGGGGAPDDDSGCGCRTAGRPAGLPPWWSLAAASLVWAVARRSIRRR